MGVSYFTPRWSRLANHSRSDYWVLNSTFEADFKYTRNMTICGIKTCK